MCKPPAKMFDSDNEIGRANSKIDPMGARIATGNKSKLDPLNLKNDPDLLPVTPPPQEQKLPDTMATRRTRRARNNGTALTGPAGVLPGSYATGGTTLLGG